MIALYFPFTFVRPAAAWLTAAFETPCLLAPSAEKAREGLAPGIDADRWRVLFPSRGDEAALQRIEAQMRDWAAVHSGSDLAALLASRPGEAPFFGAPEISRLRQDIRTHARERQSANGPDPLWAARIFLSFAHGLDRDRADLADAWQSLADVENEMLRALHGASEDAVPPGAPATTGEEDPGHFLTGHRLSAWARLALDLAPAPDLVVTDSAAVFQAVRDAFPALRELFTWPAGRRERLGADQLEAAIQAALRAEAPVPEEAAGTPGALQIAALDLCFEDFCRGLAAGARGRPAAAGPGRLVIAGPAN